MVQPLWKTVWQFLINPDRHLPYNCTYRKEMETYVYSKTCRQMFIAALFIIATSGKQLKCISIDEWLNNLW